LETVVLRGKSITAHNSGLAKGGLTCFDDTFVLKQTFVLRMNFSAKNSALRQAAKRSAAIRSSRKAGSATREKIFYN